MKPLYNDNSNKIKLIKSQELLLYILASGITYKEAAQMLGVSYNTAKHALKLFTQNYKYQTEMN